MSNLKKLFVDICKGYSIKKWNNQNIYIKHISIIDQAIFDDRYNEYIEEAKIRGLFTLKDRLELLEKEGLWSKKDQSELNNQKLYLDNLIITKNQLAIGIQIKQKEKEIKIASQKYNELFNKKNELIGLTCESIADKKIELFYIENLFFQDSRLKIKKFNNEEFEKLEESDINNLLELYFSFLIDFSNDNMKKISISDFFTSLLYLSENFDSFFGKPLYQLTYYQNNLLSYGVYYKNLISNNNIPKNIVDDPDKIEEFVKKTNNMKKMIEKGGNENGEMGIVGISKEEITAMGGIGGIPDSLKLSMKRGGINSIEELSDSNKK